MKKLLLSLPLYLYLFATIVQVQMEQGAYDQLILDEQSTKYQKETPIESLQELSQALQETKGDFKNDQEEGKCVRYASVDGKGEDSFRVRSDSCLCQASSN